MNLARIALLIAVCVADGYLLVADVAPPPARVENEGHPRDGYTWAPGHWSQWRYVPGHWER